MAESTPEQRAKRAAYMREWRLRPENHERVKAGQRAKYHRNREANKARAKSYYWANRDASIAAARQWEIEHPEQAAVRKQAWAEANRDKANEAYRRWRERNPEVARLRQRAYAARRRVRESASVFAITDKDLRRLTRNGCAYCGGEATEMDHLIPVARGGRHAVGNLVGACRSCNAKKNHRLLTEWRLGRVVSRA